MLLKDQRKSTAVEIFVGQDRMLKFDLSKEICVKALGPLMASKDVQKVVPKIDDIHCKVSAQTFKKYGFTFENVFDIASASKVCNYFHEGSSVLKSELENHKSMCEKYEIPRVSWKMDAMKLYLHLSSLLSKGDLQG